MEQRNSQTLKEKIEKLKIQLSEDDQTGFNDSDNQWKRKDKLMHKLRYLEFYDSFPLGECPKEWHCSFCKKTQVTKKVVIRPPPMKGNQKDVKINKKEHFEKVDEWVCEFPEEHRRQWETEEKSKAEVRQEIRHKFSAMITKEKEMSNSKIDKTKQMKVSKAVENSFPTIKAKDDASMTQNKAEKNLRQETCKSDQSAMKNFHSDDCKTCVRMQSLMGQILPHPVNIA